MDYTPQNYHHVCAWGRVVRIKTELKTWSLSFQIIQAYIYYIQELFTTSFFTQLMGVSQLLFIALAVLSISDRLIGWLFLVLYVSGNWDICLYILGCVLKHFYSVHFTGLLTFSVWDILLIFVNKKLFQKCFS